MRPFNTYFSIVIWQSPFGTQFIWFSTYSHLLVYLTCWVLGLRISFFPGLGTKFLLALLLFVGPFGSVGMTRCSMKKFLTPICRSSLEELDKNGQHFLKRKRRLPRSRVVSAWRDRLWSFFTRRDGILEGEFRCSHVYLTFDLAALFCSVLLGGSSLRSSVCLSSPELCVSVSEVVT